MIKQLIFVDLNLVIIQFFFDNLGENLQPAKLLGWTTVHIDQVYLPKGMKTCDKIDFIDYTWGNINEALEHFISLIKK